MQARTKVMQGHRGIWIVRCSRCVPLSFGNLSYFTSWRRAFDEAHSHASTPHV